MAEEGTATAIGKAQNSMMDAAQKLAAKPELQDRLRDFYHMWGMDAYHPDKQLMSEVRGIVGGFLVASKAFKPDK